MTSIVCGHSMPYSQTFPASGSMRSGLVFEHPPWVPRMDGSGFSSSRGLLFDTPDTMPDAPNAGSNRKAQPAGLGNQVHALLRTPDTDSGGRRNPERLGATMRLADQIAEEVEAGTIRA